MADEPGTSRRSRKRKRTSEEDSGPPIPELVETMKKKSKEKGKKTSKKSRKKKNKDKELKPQAIPRSVHLFRPGKGQGTCTISPLKISSIQDLILFASLRQTESRLSTPKWCPYIHKAGSIQRVIIVLVSGVGAIEYAKNQDCFSQSSDIFEDCVETKASGPDFCVKLPHESLLSVNLSQNELKRRREEQLCNGNIRLGREDYILSIDEMWENDYPVPGHVSYDANKLKDSGFLSTKANNGSTNSSESPMYAIDCEMCQTTEGMELTRISLVDESLSVVYDTLVQPSSPIIDYKTEFSGITSKMLENVTTTLPDVQKRLIDLLPPDAILLGHSLENDLRALKLHHGRVIDTSVMYSTPRGAFFKPSLRSLAKQHLKKKIQNGADGHCSIEDANACMELVQLKIQNGPNFGKPPADKEGLFERTARCGKIASMLDYPGVLRKFSRGTTHAISCTSDEEMVSHAVKLMQTSDILWAHLHEPEMFLKEDQSNVEGKQERTWKDVLQSVDSRIKQIHEATPSDSLLLIVLGCGDLSPVKRLQRQMKSHKAELKEAVRTAKKGVCFMKIKS